MRLALLLLLGACAEPPPCADGAALEWSQDFTQGPHAPGDDVWFDTPPQGGAPYAPFEIRLKAELPPGTRLLAHATATEIDSGERLGSDQPPGLPGEGTLIGALCSNAGVHAGWWYAGEVHVRFWGHDLDALAGREVDLDLTLALPHGDVRVTGTTGTLVRRAE